MDRAIEHHDVVVVGSRCAGAATAMLLARAGHDVLVVDRARFPSDLLSTHGIARGGVVQLARWGLLDDVLASGAPAVREVSFHRDGAVVTRGIKAKAGVDHVVAPRRYVLDSLLVSAARSAGAEVREGVTATALRRAADTARVTGLALRDRRGRRYEVGARLVVGADGVRSWAARQVGAPAVEEFVADSALFYTYLGDVDWRGFEFHVAPRAFAGVFPTHDGEAAVWLCRPTALLAGVQAAGRDRMAALTEQLDAVAPDLARRVRRGRVSAPVRGAVRMPNHVRRPTGPGWALVGDAGYHRDPITGHGMTDAFRDAELLASAVDRALRDGTPEAEQAAGKEYQQARDVSLRPTFDLTRELLRYPHVECFTDLQVQLAEVLDTEAHDLSRLPAPAGGTVAA